MKSFLKYLFFLILLLSASQAHAQEGLFWTKKDILENFLANSQKVVSEDFTLDTEKKKEIRKMIGYIPEKTEYTFFIGKSGNRDDGFILFDEQLGQHKLISYAVHISPKGEIVRTEVMIYREPQGGDVRDKRFMRQYQGKTVDSALRVNSDVTPISGATISSKSLTVGVKRALALWHLAYGSKN